MPMNAKKKTKAGKPSTVTIHLNQEDAKLVVAALQMQSYTHLENFNRTKNEQHNQWAADSRNLAVRIDDASKGLAQ